jgi:hypothetical protein
MTIGLAVFSSLFETFFSVCGKINPLPFELFRNITTFAALKMRVIQFLKEI